MECRGARGFVIAVILAAVAETVTSVHADLSAYPQWLVVLVGTLVAALIIWILMKLLKLALWLLFFGVLFGGLAWSVWLVVQ